MYFKLCIEVPGTNYSLLIENFEKVPKINVAHCVLQPTAIFSKRRKIDSK